MRTWKFIGTVVVLVWLSACAGKQEEVPVVDWVKFLRNAEVALNAERPEVHITFELNGAAEELRTDSVAWSDVFGRFLSDSITAFTMERLYERTEELSATDSFVHWELPKKGRKPFAIRLAYARGTDSLVFIQLVNKTENLLYSSFQEVVYRRDDSLLIRGYHSMRWGEPNSYKQLIRFKK